MIETNNINDLIGATVYDSDDDKIGTVGQVYVDADNQSPLWVTIKTGLFGSSESFAPLTEATFDGESVRVPFEKAFVKDAPRVDDDGTLSHDEEAALFSYYGHGGAPIADTSDVGTADLDDRPSEGHDTSGPTTDDAMTRSEEHLQVGTEKVETGRARLRKHVVTDTQTVTVPVTHEEVTLEREPITDSNIGDATAGPALSDEEHEVVLTEERVVVNKETVPVERVQLGTEAVTEQREVTEEVAHEEVELVEPQTNRVGTDSDGLDRSDRAETDRL